MTTVIDAEDAKGAARVGLEPAAPLWREAV